MDENTRFRRNNVFDLAGEAVSGVMSELAKEGVVKLSRLSVQRAVTILEENIPRNSIHCYPSDPYRVSFS